MVATVRKTVGAGVPCTVVEDAATPIPAARHLQRGTIPSLVTSAD